jgi:hypothetical protein
MFIKSATRIVILGGTCLSLWLETIIPRAWASPPLTCEGYETDSLLQSDLEKCKGLEAQGRLWSCVTNTCGWEAVVYEKNQSYRDCYKKHRSNEKEMYKCIDEITKGIVPDDYKYSDEDENYFQNIKTDIFDISKFSMFYVHLLLITISLIGLLLQNYNLWGAGQGVTCPWPKSYLAFFPAALVFLIGEGVTFKQLKDKLSSLQEDITLDDNPETSTSSASNHITNSSRNRRTIFLDLQRKSFDLLAEEQKIIADIFHTRIFIYGLAAAGYYLAAIISGIEWVVNWGIGSPDDAANFKCTQKAIEEDASKSATTTAPPTPQPGAPVAPPAAGAPGAAGAHPIVAATSNPPAKAAVDKFKRTWGAKLNQPISRFAVFSVAASLTTVMAKYAADVSKNAEDNEKHIKNLKEKFLSFQSTYFCDDRTNYTHPQCYCYDEFGERDKDKGNSQVCQKYWEQEDFRDAPPPNNYVHQQYQGTLEPKGCVDISGAFDPVCNCRRYVNKKGDNSCKKVQVVTTTMGTNIQAITKNFEKAANSFFSNNTNGQSLTTGNINRLAGQIRQSYLTERKRFLDSLKEKGYKGDLHGKDSLELNAFKNMRSQLDPFDKQLRKQFGGLGIGAKFDRSLFNQLPSEMVKAVDDLEKKIAKKAEQSSLFYNDSGNSTPKKEKKKDQFSLYGQDEDQKNESRILGGTFESKQNKTGIPFHNARGPSLWQIISLRYYKSGLPRLFPEENESVENPQQIQPPLKGE